MGYLPLSKRRKNQAGTQGVSHAHAPMQEKRIANKLGGRTTLASGALAEKGDVRVHGVARIEAKSTVKRSFSITEDMLHKIETAAMASGEVPAIYVDFLTNDGQLRHTVAVLPSHALDSLLDALN